jgi:SNF2 family DNA or RNA helicase
MYLLLHTASGKKVRKPGPHLIVVPSSVLSNWQKELAKFCPALDVAVYHGSQVRAVYKQHSIALLYCDAMPCYVV